MADLIHLGAYSLLLLEFIFKITFILCICLTVYLLLRNASASIKVHLLRCTLGLTLFLPVLIIALPEINIVPKSLEFTNTYKHYSPSHEYNAFEGNESRSTQHHNSGPAYFSSYTFWSIMTIWAMGFIYFLGNIFRQIYISKKIIKHSVLLSDDLRLATNSYFSSNDLSPIYVSDEVLTPVVVGFTRQRIVLPEGFIDWDEDKLLSSVLHEQAHIDSKDNLARLISLIACAFYWFHPLVWYCFRKLKEEQEKAADNHVISKGVCASTYAKNLLDIVKLISGNDKHSELLATMGTYSFFPNRMKEILTGHKQREKLTMTKALLILLSTTTLVMSISAVTTAKEVSTENINAKLETPYNSTSKPTYDNSALSEEELLLASAIESGDHRTFESLLERGLKFKSSNQATFLALAESNGDLAMMNLLLESGHKVTSVKNNGLLLSATSRGDKNMVELLLEAGTPVDKKSLGALLEKAKKSGNEEIADLLNSAYGGTN